MHNAFHLLGIGEHRGKKEVVFVAQFGSLGKKHSVNVLGKAQAFSHVIKIIGYATNHHVALRNVVARQRDALALEEALTFVEGERREFHSAGESSVESSIVVDEFVGHP